jgi:hypothetical protein
VRTSTFAGDHVALGVEAFDSDGAPVVTVRVSPDGPPAIGADVGVRVDPFGALAFPR